MARGIWARQLGSVSARYGAVSFQLPVTTVAATASYILPDANGWDFPIAILRVRGVMTGPGGAGDTVQVTNAAGNAITEAIDVSALTTNDTFAASVNSVQYSTIVKGSHFHVVTTSGTTCTLLIECVRV